MITRGTAGEDTDLSLKMMEKQKTDPREDGASTDLNPVTGMAEEQETAQYLTIADEDPAPEVRAQSSNV